MSEDIEKNRAEYVARLEAKLQHATAEAAKYKAIAEKWQPICHGELDPQSQNVRFTLQFGGSRCTATVGFAALSEADVTTAVSGVVDALIESMVADKIREPVRPEVERMMPSLKAALNAGKW